MSRQRGMRTWINFPTANCSLAIEGRYDILVTLDRNLVYQQKMSGRPFSVIVLRVADQTPEAFRALVPALIDALRGAKPGEVRQVSA